MDLHIQKVADRMGEKRGAGQSSRILSQGLDPYEGGRSLMSLSTVIVAINAQLLKIKKG
jgi:hypothetical protein